MVKLKAAVDLSKATDEERIQIIGQTLMAGPKTSTDEPMMVGVVCDDATKAAIYVHMMKQAFPTVRHIDTKPMGIGKTVAIRFGEPAR